MAAACVSVNGERRELPESDGRGCTLAELLRRVAPDAPPGRLAVEVNLNVIPRERYATTQLSDGDRIEIVSFVGGG
jgi:sulfur carrier protein